MPNFKLVCKSGLLLLFFSKWGQMQGNERVQLEGSAAALGGRTACSVSPTQGPKPTNKRRNEKKCFFSVSFLLRFFRLSTLQSGRMKSCSCELLLLRTHRRCSSVGWHRRFACACACCTARAAQRDWLRSKYSTSHCPAKRAS